MHRPRLTLLSLTMVAACNHPGGSSSTHPRACRADPPPTLEAPPSMPAVTSHVTVGVAVTEERLRREIARQLPETLDSGQRIVGPGVRVSYVVKRGDLAFSLDKERIYVETPITASASACKTLGPLCITLGRCGPRIDVRVAVPAVLNADYGWGPSRVTTDVVHGCNIAGFDATGEISRRASSEAANAERQIDGSLPDLATYAKAGWAALHT